MYVGLLVWVVSIYGCRRLAVQKGRNVKNWTVAAIFAGVIALIILALLPSQSSGSGVATGSGTFPPMRFTDGKNQSDTPPTDGGGFNPPKFG